jgi:DNA polymerase-3 subunit epsilon
LAGNRGFAFLDLETTGFGFHSGDRIVEVGIVLTDNNLNLEDTWTTLINPQRGVGPSGVHGIEQSWVAKAPTFLQVAPDIAYLLNGRSLVAHNSSFDIGFMRSEFSRTDVASNVDVVQPICSMRLSKSLLPSQPRHKLSWLAYALNLRPSDHTALGDALTTLELVRNLKNSFSNNFGLGRGDVFRSDVSRSSFKSLVTRRAENEEDRGGLLQEIRNQLPFRTGLTAGVIEYIETLDAALFDNHLSREEIDVLVSLATFWGLGVDEILKAHSEYFSILLESSWADGRLTPRELETLKIRSEWLGIDHDELKRGIERSANSAAFDLPFGLRAGDLVCLTGDMIPPKSVISSLLTEHGILVKTSFSSKTSLLVAAQTNSLSGKAQNARSLGVPIVSAAEVSEAFQGLLAG